MNDLVEKIETEFNEFSKDAQLLIKNGNNAAGVRARKASLELEKMLKEFRKVSIEESKK